MVNVAGLHRRAAALARTRQFFAKRDVLEVETPVLASYSVTEPHIQSIRATVNSSKLWLRTSPEYHMKRLLAAGCPELSSLDLEGCEGVTDKGVERLRAALPCGADVGSP